MIGGGAGLGLMLAWAVWPRRYAPNLTAAPGETLFGAWLKIGEDGHVTVAVPQAEYGQGAWTALPQILADELGADWRTVAVEPAPLNPLYANPLGANELFEGLFALIPPDMRAAHATRTTLMLTAGSSSVRGFEDDLRRAGAAARVLLSKAAAAQWGVDWRACAADGGFIQSGTRKLRFGALAAAAAKYDLPDELPMRLDDNFKLAGQSLPRLDVPAKVDGSANFAADIRFPGMVFAAIAQAPLGGALAGLNRAAAQRTPGFVALVEQPGWVAAVANTWWAANRAVEATRPRFSGVNETLHQKGIDQALDSALDGPGTRMLSRGDLSTVFRGARVVTAAYRVGLAAHAALETPSATARYDEGRLQLWLPTLAPGLARDAAAAALGIDGSRVTVHPMLVGGSFGAGLETDVAVQAALIAKAVGRPVQLVWSRAEDLRHDRYRPPAAARLSARLGANGTIMGWLAKIAAPATGQELARRLLAHDAGARAALMLEGSGDPYAIAGALPYYRFPSYAVDHHVAEIGVPTGHWRSG
ncbi:MAG: molybdopterin-dependent oxidoreductase, partial [Sphingomonas sp.]|nr:molybdopterin-dependent oxidoreductase [Sphingomonas sp.]